MSSKYYEWLARDEKPVQQRELTPEEKRRNWWDYHKWHVVIGIVCVLMAGNFVWSIIDGSRNVPDYQIAYVGSAALPDDTVAGLEAAFAAIGQDLNGNGKVQVQVNQYVVYADTSNAITESEQSYTYNTTMQLMADIETAQSVIFLVEDPEQFQADYGILCQADGTFAQDASESMEGVSFRWGDCPGLTQLDVGSFSLQYMTGPVEGSNQDLLANLYIARRGFYNGETSPLLEGAIALWNQITEGVTP